MMDEMPCPAIYLDRALTRDGTKITSRIYLDQLNRVMLARSGDGLLLRPALEWKAA